MVHPLAKPDGRADAVVPADAFPKFHAGEFRPVVHEALPRDAGDAGEVEHPVFMAQDHPGMAEKTTPERHRFVAAQGFLEACFHVIFHRIDHLLPPLQRPVVFDALDDGIKNLFAVRDAGEHVVAVGLLRELRLDGERRHELAVVTRVARDVDRGDSGVAVFFDAGELRRVVVFERARFVRPRQ